MDNYNFNNNTQANGSVWNKGRNHTSAGGNGGRNQNSEVIEY